MDELIKLVSQKTGLPAAQAKVAIDTVLGFLKQKLPAPLGSQLDSLIEGGGLTSALGGLGDMGGLGDLGDLFGKK